MNDVLLIDATEEFQPLAEELKRAGFRVDTCPSEEALERLTSGSPVDVLLVNLLDSASQAAVQHLLTSEAVPGHTAAIGLVHSMDLAALPPELPVDDIIVAPARPDELIARVKRAIWRHAGAGGSNVLRSGELTIDQDSYKAFIGGRPVSLTFKEYELLRFLVINQGKVCSREMLLSQVWGYEFYGGGRTVDVHIRRLRSKIEDSAHNFIETVRNVGYCFQAK